ncbi:MAG: L-aspartate oxidase [Candidatus Kryptoniota bacterium]
MNCDVLVIGAGIAGLSTAIKLADQGKNVIVINRAFDPDESNTRYAQGGIVWWGEDDSYESIESDIDEAGDEVGAREAIRILAEEGPTLVNSFLIGRLKINFDRDAAGNLHRTLEGGHSRRRIIHVGDQTGAAIEEALSREARDHPNVQILAGHTAVDLISTTHHSRKRGSVYQSTRILGAYVIDRKSREVKTILASYTVIATGGVGGIYEYTTNPEGARGDGIAMAARAGAHIINMEYVQFHPTAFRKEGCSSFLISEAVRGEGAVLLNDGGERFISRYCPDAMELAPRDEVARGIFWEIQGSKSKNVWLDCSPIVKKGIDLKERFPQIFARCLSCGVDIRNEPIPVSPAAHFLCGGIRVDKWGKTNLQRLYAVGEASCTGLHGANRLASTSLLEGLVWGIRAAENIVGTFEREYFDEWQIPDWDESNVIEKSVPEETIDMYMSQLKRIMWEYVGIVRSEERLSKAWRLISLINVEVEELYRRTKLSDNLVGLRNAVEVALEITMHARRNRVSRGVHFREDSLKNKIIS